MDNSPIPLERLLYIAKCAAKKYRRPNHQDFDDLVQEIVLGVLQRQSDYDPNKGGLEKFVIGVAYQKAADRSKQFDLQLVQSTTNHRTRIPYRYKPRDLDELDEHGRLRYQDEKLRIQRFASLFEGHLKEIFLLLLKGCDMKSICRRRGYSTRDFERDFEQLKKNYFENQNFVENNDLCDK